MDWLIGLDWKSMLTIDKPLAEIFLRGTVMYLGLFFMLRFVRRREVGAMGITDLLVLVLIADAAQNAMADDYRSLPEGLVLVGTIIGWSYALDWLGYHVAFLGRLLEPAPLTLIEHGQMLRRHMRRELITEEELMSQLRLQGVDDVKQVKRAYMESDGRISVLADPPPEQKPAPEKLIA